MVKKGKFLAGILGLGVLCFLCLGVNQAKAALTAQATYTLTIPAFTDITVGAAMGATSFPAITTDQISSGKQTHTHMLQLGDGTPASTSYLNTNDEATVGELGTQNYEIKITPANNENITLSNNGILTVANNANTASVKVAMVDHTHTTLPLFGGQRLVVDPGNNRLKTPTSGTLAFKDNKALLDMAFDVDESSLILTNEAVNLGFTVIFTAISNQ